MPQLDNFAPHLSDSAAGIFGIRLGDQPSFEVIDKEASIEIRHYDPLILAAITVTANAETDAIVRLARYLYGRNGAKKTMALTTPTAKDELMTSFFMTAPVLRSKIDELVTISVVLPHEYTIASAPVPMDPGIFLVDKPGHLKAVTKATQDCANLMNWIKNNDHYIAVGALQMAQYDAPNNSSFFRRDEWQLEIVEKQ